MADYTVLTNPQQQLIDLINQDNGSTLTLADVTLSDPSVVDYAGRNTKVTVTGNVDSPYENTKDVFYNRLALTRLGFIGIITDTPLTNEQFLDTISSNKQVKLLEGEFEPFTIPVLEVGAIGSVTLIAKPTAIKWLGQVDAEYVFGVPAGFDALHTLINVTLPADGYLT